jgi:hypothetical protein
MSAGAPEPEPGYHLFLDPGEIRPAASALRLLISDEAHEPVIRALARSVLDRLEGAGDQQLTLELEPREMKITHSAVKLLLNDLGREQHDEREILRAILEKLPDEHVMRAIEIE